MVAAFLAVAALSIAVAAETPRLSEVLGFDPLHEPELAAATASLPGLARAAATVERSWAAEPTAETAVELARWRVLQRRFDDADSLLRAASTSLPGPAAALDVVAVRRALQPEASPGEILRGADAAIRLERSGRPSGLATIERLVGLGPVPSWSVPEPLQPALARIDWYLDEGFQHGRVLDQATLVADPMAADLRTLVARLEGRPDRRRELTAWVQAYRRSECQEPPAWLGQEPTRGLDTFLRWTRLVASICALAEGTRPAREYLETFAADQAPTSWLDVRARWQRGIIAAIEGDLVEARRRYLEAIEAARRTGDTLAIAGLDIALAELEYESGGTFEEVAGRLVEALRLTRGLDPRRRLGAVHFVVEIARRNRLIDLAASLAREAGSVAAELGNVAEAQSLVFAARIQADTGEFTEADRLLARAQPLLDDVHAAPAWLARVAAAAAEVALLAGRPDHETALARAQVLLESVGYEALASDLVGARGLALLARGRADEASAQLRQALGRAGNILDRERLAMALRRIEIERGEVDAALDVPLPGRPASLGLAGRIRSRLALGAERSLVTLLDLGDDELAVVEVTREGSAVLARASAATLEHLARAVGVAAELGLSPDDVDPAIRRLRALFGLPSASQPLAAVLPGRWWSLPIEAMVGPNVVVGVAPDAERWLALDPHPVVSERSLWAVGPEVSSGLSVGREEVQAVQRTWAQLAAAGHDRGAQVLHVVGHGGSDHGGVDLGGGRFFDASDLGTRSPAIVVLNGCETLGSRGVGRLAEDLLARGAAVLGTIRVIGDAPAGQFGLELQGQLARGLSLAEAFAHSRCAIARSQGLAWSAYRLIARVSVSVAPPAAVPLCEEEET